MAILRKIKKSDFTVIDNNIFKNKNLSYKAKGLLCTMLSLPDDWNFSEEGLATLSNDSRTSVRSSLKELIEFGYLTRTRERNEDGKLGESIYTIYEEPMYQNPTLEKPTLENVHNKILNNKELKNKKEINKERFKKPTVEEVSLYCKERNNGINPEAFVNFYESKGWKVGRTPMKDWKAAVRTWELHRATKEVVVKDLPGWFNQEQDIKPMTKQEEEQIRKEFDELLNF